ncbi:hypothetical protein H5410_044941 [Solanum commersonii]|uniref:Uncharacterized protein n=1 Tax=Solanum commersonii TaxID=4109 RepID=A0A9J5X8B9_SOLCO|nr:hypothetical protein H5410_044941 [Solanum commersonii]
MVMEIHTEEHVLWKDVVAKHEIQSHWCTSLQKHLMGSESETHMQAMGEIFSKISTSQRGMDFISILKDKWLREHASDG